MTEATAQLFKYQSVHVFNEKQPIIMEVQIKLYCAQTSSKFSQTYKVPDSLLGLLSKSSPGDKPSAD